MNCPGLRGSLHAWLEGQLDAQRAAELEEHRRACQACTELMAAATATSCRRFTDFLDDYIEGTLDAGQRRTFERHLDLCPPCVDYLRSYELTRELGRRALAEGEGAADAFPEDLVRAILSARRGA